MPKCNCKLNTEESLNICDDFTKYTEYEENLFGIFNSLYENGDLVFKGIPVKMKHFPPDYSERTGFYHLVYENFNHTNVETDRLPNLERCSRLTWINEFLVYCIDNCNCLMIWENTRHGKHNILLFCPDVDYLVVLTKRNHYLLLTTAYPVEYENRKNDLIREYEGYKNKQRTTTQ